MEIEPGHEFFPPNRRGALALAPLLSGHVATSATFVSLIASIPFRNFDECGALSPIFLRDRDTWDRDRSDNPIRANALELLFPSSPPTCDYARHRRHYRDVRHFLADSRFSNRDSVIPVRVFPLLGAGNAEDDASVIKRLAKPPREARRTIHHACARERGLLFYTRYKFQARFNCFAIYPFPFFLSTDEELAVCEPSIGACIHLRSGECCIARRTNVMKNKCKCEKFAPLAPID